MNEMQLLEGEIECRAKGHPFTKGDGWCDCRLLGGMSLRTIRFYDGPEEPGTLSSGIGSIDLTEEAE